jgi:hypothetical protein
MLGRVGRNALDLVFSLSLSLNPDRKPLEITAEVLDDIFSINAEDHYCLMISLCYFFEDFQTFHFKVSGFGSDSWPVSHSTELSCFLEVAPGILEWINDGYPGEFVLEFFEQGFGMDIFFQKNGSMISVNINDSEGYGVDFLVQKNDSMIFETIKLSGWRPAETHDSINQRDFESAFFEINKLFLKHAVSAFPQIRTLSFFPTIVELCQGEID